MSAGLRPMREDEFGLYLERSRAGYVDDMIRNARMPPEVAHRKAQVDIDGLFPEGFASNVELRVVEDDAGEAVGRLVYAEREQHGRRYAFLYDIEIDEAQRGRGYGRVAMQLLEGEVRELGLGQLQLNVFGGNAAARALYRSLGFEELSVQMGKELR